MSGVESDPMNASRALRAPGPFLLALEGRAPWEFGATLAAWPILRQAPRGDGHSIVVFPGLAASDVTTVPLRTFLDNQGYDAHGWKLKFNFGPRKGVLEASLERVRRFRRESGRRVSLVGWSLGGVFAREIAKLLPDDVRCVITLGSPFTGHPKANNAWRIYQLVSGHRLEDDEAMEHVRKTPPVPTTSIFSRTDGIVAWQCCLQAREKQAESIEVQASHFGIGMHPASWYAVADRLAQPEGAWRPFHREGWREWLYRDPYRAQDRD
jgi:pimeloyl-ACP methyl ester carboxylesterase